MLLELDGAPHGRPGGRLLSAVTTSTPYSAAPYFVELLNDLDPAAFVVVPAGLRLNFPGRCHAQNGAAATKPTG